MSDQGVASLWRNQRHAGRSHKENNPYRAEQASQQPAVATTSLNSVFHESISKGWRWGDFRCGICLGLVGLGVLLNLHGLEVLFVSMAV